MKERVNLDCEENVLVSFEGAVIYEDMILPKRKEKGKQKVR